MDLPTRSLSDSEIFGSSQATIAGALAKLENSTVLHVSSRTALANISDVIPDQIVTAAIDGKSCDYIYLGGDQHIVVASDPGGMVYIAPINAPDGTQGCWMKLPIDVPDSVGLFSGLSNRFIPNTLNMVRTTGYTNSGIGAAKYIADASITTSSVTAIPGSGFVSKNGRGFRLFEEILNPEMFGALGDGVTNDMTAFRNMSAFVSARNGGIISLFKKTYRCGSQDVAYRIGYDAMLLKDCDSVVIYGNNATLKWVDGLRFGTFYPGTNTPYPSLAPYYDDHDGKVWAIGTGIYAWNVNNLQVYDLTFDLNAAKQLIGGEFGDIGRQCNAYGYFVRDCINVLFESVRVIESLQDGGSCAQYGLPENASPRPHVFINCSTYHAGRNGFSVLGANQFLAINCSFDRSGQISNDVFGSFGTAPGSGVDVEAEGGICRNVRFENCYFGQATGNAFVADSGDTSGITFENCIFGNSANPVIFWSSKPYTHLYNCTINGIARKLYGGGRSEIGGTLLVDTIINGLVPNDICIDSQGSGSVELIRCGLVLTKGGFNLRGSIMDSCTISVVGGTDNYPDRASIGYLEGVQTFGAPLQVTTNSPAGKDPANGYVVEIATNSSYLIGKAIASGKMYWNYITPDFTGEIFTKSFPYAGITNSSSTSPMFVPLNLNMTIARVGDRIDLQYTGSANGVMMNAQVVSDDAICIPLTVFPSGYLRAGNFVLRLRKN